MLDEGALYFFCLVSYYKLVGFSLNLLACNTEADNRQTSEFELLCFGCYLSKSFGCLEPGWSL